MGRTFDAAPATVKARATLVWTDRFPSSWAPARSPTARTIRATDSSHSH
jgi:hypothetical protein